MDLCEEFRVEEKIYKLLHRRKYIGFPRFLRSGVDNFNRGYLAIEVLGPSLKKILHHQKHRISPQTSLQLGIQLTYLCENGRHIQNERQSTFMGNFVFSSVYQMLGHSPSRKDDLLSIFYLLLYFKDGKLPWVIKQNDGKIKTMSFDQVRKAKQDFHSEIKMKSQTCLIRCLIKYCDKLQFEEKPRYDIIIKNLLTQLNSLNTIKEQWAMDWTKLTSNWCNRMVEFSEQFKYFENPISQKMKKISGESSNGGRNFSILQERVQYFLEQNSNEFFFGTLSQHTFIKQ
ncbi:UNKNOWN [Stylonychia lemnae]|uniref:Casein kinase I n=1 Tax=Stylonychia lemnae TaxID=5949 RepID=A0A078ASD4_STYLE|nr:UNKNOWN [Stylonychia lemnae]|eukprot:CDW85094.1 UNKNOWN [Stylonychia lemnae]